MWFKEMIKEIRKELKEAYKGYKVSVRERQGGYSYAMSIHITDQEGNELDRKSTELASSIVKKYQDAGDTDVYTDYFDYNFYYSINGGL